MTTKSNLGKYSRLRRKLALLCEDINFLRSCIQHKVIPLFVRTSVAINNSRSLRAKTCADRMWLKTELKFIYKKLSDIELQAYSLHLLITKDFEYSNSFHYDFDNKHDEWINFTCNLRSNTELVRIKRMKQLKKLKKLFEKSSIKIRKKPLLIPDIVVNKSEENFSEEQLAFLNIGLKYSLRPNKPHFVPLVMDIETVLKPVSNSVKEDIRRTVE